VPVRGATVRVAMLSMSLLAACAHDPYLVSIDTTTWIRALGSDQLNESDTAEEGLATDNVFSSNFGQPTLFIDPRRAMLGVRLNLGQ